MAEEMPAGDEDRLDSTEWQRIASRKLFQHDHVGAIEAMRRAVAVDPANFHHWMWLGNIYRQIADEQGSRDAALAALRCLDNGTGAANSPEERTRLVVRASILAGVPVRAEQAVRSLEALRRSALDRCLTTTSFGDWYEADLFAAPIFETILELRLLIGEPLESRAALDRYLASLDHAARLAADEDASNEDCEVLHLRRRQALEQLAHPL